MKVKKAIKTIEKNSLYLLGLSYIICLVTRGVGGYIWDFVVFISIVLSCVSYSKYLQIFSIANLLVAAVAALLGADTYAALFFYFFLVPSGAVVARTFFGNSLK